MEFCEANKPGIDYEYCHIHLIMYSGKNSVRKRFWSKYKYLSASSIYFPVLLKKQKLWKKQCVDEAWEGLFFIRLYFSSCNLEFP